MCLFLLLDPLGFRWDTAVWGQGLYAALITVHGQTGDMHRAELGTSWLVCVNRQAWQHCSSS